MKHKIFRALRYFFLVLLAGIVFYVLFNFQLVNYGLSQLRGQLHIVINARPAEELLNDRNFPDSLKKKLQLVDDIRRFAIDSLGLKNSKNYTTVYDQKGKPALWVLTACEPFAMKAYEWKFPLLGAVSYKGFFEKEKGIPELEALKQGGYDTDYSPTGGWSTLGWFKDPILSNMLRRSEGQLAELMIHELTHATLYLPGSVDYNENFATFTGEQGALQFLAYRFGSESKELKAYADLQYDEEIFGKYMVTAAKELEVFYQSLDTGMSHPEKVTAKYRKINSIVFNINDLKLKNPDRFRLTDTEGKLPNNCLFMSYRRYRKQQEEFKVQLMKYNGDLKNWLLNLQREND
ncbi:MAG: aminopeptidase [Bacteroidetes bacterium]|nr:aminopeptidase [Bacteroidota bacterium]